MKKKPHHSTVFRRKATEQINQLNATIAGHACTITALKRRIDELSAGGVRLEADKQEIHAKLSAMATKLAAVEEALNSLLKTVDEDQKTIDRLTATLREIYEETLGVAMQHELEPSLEALNAVKHQIAHSEGLAKELTKAKAMIATLEGDLGTLKREASVHRDSAAFLESQLRRRDNTCGKLMAGLIALGAIAIGVAIYNL